ncbi:MAG TPA: LacI family DNA-binding transcriptional regulator [Candidatus Avipropionibacterium avicola]|uniref:LacI family DNA-binding transcriptional regulator n=1 Tax=Candidatus Avipropionibacterium avicola TaxID=2840701 RepID=A0A9D1KN40_9ACTN|nr:LacI family DNA-binding transcriptional regulator [Candidatus Avipropionibacterium avicola]
MAVTLADIAGELGLSTSTVSRALSNPDLVNDATRERVQETARKLGYAGPGLGRPRANAGRGVIGMMVPDIVNPFFPPIIKAAQSRALSKGRAIMLADLDEHPDDELGLARLLRERVDGLIMVSPRASDEGLAEYAELAPVVFVNRLVDGLPSVVIDNADGMYEAVEHLAALGHQRIGYLNGPRRSWSNRMRRDAVVAAAESLKVELEEFGPFEPEVQSGVRAADLVVSAGVTGVIAYDDMIALGVMVRLAERGLRVGPDVSVLGIDDAPMAGMAYPALTTVHVPGVEAGRIAVDTVLDQIEGHHTGRLVRRLDTRLVIRSSTQSPA